MKRRARRVLLLLAVFLALVWLNNSSLFSTGDDKPLLIAHRGLAPEMHPERGDYSACFSRIHASEHSYIENTIPAMEAAFDLGADYVEFDVRATADGRFVVFHDDVLDCKTDSTGRVINYSMAELKALDIGYGYYTASNGYPLRGKGVGLMPSLEEVLDRFPQDGFVIDVKGNDRNVRQLRVGALGLAASVCGADAERRYDGDTDAPVPDGVNSRFAGDVRVRGDDPPRIRRGDQDQPHRQDPALAGGSAITNLLCAIMKSVH